jgi:hypothetical protein
MKRILVILSVMSIVFFISGRVSAQTTNKPPIRTVDPHPAVQRVVPVALPIKSGGGERAITPARPGAVKAILPLMKSGGAPGPGGNKLTPAGLPGGLQPGGGANKQ